MFTCNIITSEKKYNKYNRKRGTLKDNDLLCLVKTKQKIALKEAG